MINTEVATVGSLSHQDIERLYGIMIHAYAVTEEKIWGPNYMRMSKEEFLGLIEQERLLIARLNGSVVGSIHTYPLNSTSYAFGLLSADFEQKGKGIGATLIAAAERFAQERGATIMELEILKPRDLEIAQKTMLKEWYIKLGYTFTTTQTFEARKPDKAEKANNFVVPCVFDCYAKNLT